MEYQCSLSWYNLSTSAADTFYSGDFVTFDDTAGTANGSVVISGTSGSVLPGSVTVSNTAVNYTFSGVPIAGPTSLTKSGPGNLTSAAATRTAAARIYMAECSTPMPAPRWERAR